MKKTHGESGTRLYAIWMNMKERCSNENGAEYHRYGGRGINVCEEWTNSFESFRNWAIKNGYLDILTLDRIDNDGNYSPENCQWITRSENSAKAQGKTHEEWVEAQLSENKDKYAAQMRYDAKNVVRVTIKFNKKTDDDILSKLDMEKPLSTQIKKFIRNGFEKED